MAIALAATIWGIVTQSYVELIVALLAGGMDMFRAMRLLIDNGFSEVFNLKGGVRADALFFDINDNLGNFAPNFRPETFIPGFRRTAAGIVAGLVAVSIPPRARTVAATHAKPAAIEVGLLDILVFEFDDPVVDVDDVTQFLLREVRDSDLHAVAEERIA